MSTAEHEQVIKDHSLGACDEIFSAIKTNFQITDEDIELVEDTYAEIVCIIAEDILKARHAKA